MPTVIIACLVLCVCVFPIRLLCCGEVQSNLMIVTVVSYRVVVQLRLQSIAQCLIELRLLLFFLS